MLLERIRRDLYEVVAICGRNRDCQVTAFLRENVSDRQARRMWTLLTEFVPREGPPLHNPLAAKHLRDGIYHFKRHPKKGKGVRVLWFFDERRIVCTEALFKRDDALDDAIARARVYRDQYLRDKKSNAVEIV